MRVRWNALSDRWRAVLTWGLPLFGSAILFALDWLWRIQDGVPTTAESQRLSVRVGLAFLLWAIVKVVFTQRHTFDGIGTIWALLGCAGAFIRVLGGWGPFPGDREYVAIWAALDIGATILLVSLVLWLIVKAVRRNGKEPSDA